MSVGLGAGDIANMARLAWTLAQTFGSGPTSAISEFREIQTYLFALKIALDSLATEANLHSTAFADPSKQDVLGQMVEDCRRTLLRVEMIVAKYTDKIEGSWTFKNWFKKGFKMIQWTTDGGDIKVLKGDLAAHSAAINLFVNVLNHDGIGRAISAIDKQRQSSMTSRASLTNLIKPEASFASSTLRESTFSGYPRFFEDSAIDVKKIKKIELGISRPNQSICQHATVNLELFNPTFNMKTDPLFVCYCRRFGGVLRGEHLAVTNFVKCGLSTVIVKNEAHDAREGEYLIYSSIYDSTVTSDDDKRPLVIRVIRGVQAFEASIVQYLAVLAARNLADGRIPESKWARWENEARAKPVAGKAIALGRVMVACSVKYGSGGMNIKYIPPNNSSWQAPLSVENMTIVMYRSIEKKDLYLPLGADNGKWQDGDSLRIYIDLARFAFARRTLKCEFVTHDAVKLTGSALTFKVSKLCHISNHEVQEGSGSRTSLGNLLTITAGSDGAVKLDRNNMPVASGDRPSAEAGAIMNILAPVRFSMQEFWATRISRKEKIVVTFMLLNISILGGTNDLKDEFYDSTLILLHDPASKRSRLVSRGRSGTVVMSHDVTDVDSSAITISNSNALQISESPALYTKLSENSKTGKSTETIRENRPVLYNFKDDSEDPVKCILKIFELRKTESVFETMAVEAAPPPLRQIRALSEPRLNPPVQPNAIELPDSSIATTFSQYAPTDSFIFELPGDPLERPATEPARLLYEPPPGIFELPLNAPKHDPFQRAPKVTSINLDVEITIDEARKKVLCPSATINQKLLAKPDERLLSSMQLFRCKCQPDETNLHDVVHDLEQYRMGPFTLPLLAIGGKYAKRPGCFIIVNVISKKLRFTELYVRCKSPVKEREFEEFVGSALRTRVALNVATGRVPDNEPIANPDDKPIPIHTEDDEQISLISAFGNIDFVPTAHIRTKERKSKWQPLAEQSHGLSISHYKTVNKAALQEWLLKDNIDAKDLFADTGISTLKFKPDQINDFSAHIEKSPKWHPDTHYISILMDIKDGTFFPENGDVVRYDGSWKMKFTFKGPASATSITRVEATQALAWFKFWRNRLQIELWFSPDGDEEALFETHIEHLETETEPWAFFEKFFREATISILYDDDLHRLRILTRSADNNRILSQDVLVGILQFDEKGNIKSSAAAGPLGARGLGFSQTCAIADQSDSKERRCWKLQGLVTYLFHTKEKREEFCSALANAVLRMEKDMNENFPAIHEIGSSVRETAEVEIEIAELPTFEISSPALLRRGTMEVSVYVPTTSIEGYGSLLTSAAPSPARSRSPSPKPTIVIPPSPEPPEDESPVEPLRPQKGRLNSLPAVIDDDAEGEVIESGPSRGHLVGCTCTTCGGGHHRSASLGNPLSLPQMSRSRSNSTNTTPLSAPGAEDMTRSQSNSSTPYPEYSVYTCTVPYEAKETREMSIKRGEVLHVEEEEEGDWLFAMKRRPGVGGTFRSWNMRGMVISGWVPKRCLMMEVMDGPEVDLA